jgi:hypothetical protein
VNDLEQTQAAKSLRNFWFWIPSKGNANTKDDIMMFMDDQGKLKVPSEVSREQLNKKRNELLGVGFKFQIPDLPKGAKYV